MARDQAQNAGFHARSPTEVLDALDVTPDEGLSAKAVEERQARHGANRIRSSGRRSLLRIWLAQFRSVVVAILSAAAALAFAFGEITEGIAIVAVVLINCGIGFLTEWRATRSMEALRRMGRRQVRVRRGGEEKAVAAESLVPGDICLCEGGDMVSADLRLLEANGLQVDEAALTGESVPVAKRTEAVAADTTLADRTSMLYRGTTITEGSAMAVVVEIGMDTELGRVAELAETAEQEQEQDTPMERRLNRLGHQLAWVALGAGALIGGVGLLAGRPTLLMIETAIALGVAAVPEGLLFVATIALARGMRLMARRQALINRLPAVETLGATDVILSDKTGTLTENRMVADTLMTPAKEVALRERDGRPSGEGGEAPTGADPEDPVLVRALEIGALCSNATVQDRDGDGEIEETQGDPTEVALLAAAVQHGMDPEELASKKPEVREIAFDPERMMMATVHEVDGRFEFAVKGAPQAVLEHCERIAGSGDESVAASEPMEREQRDRWNEKARELAGRGLRVLALADKMADSSDEEPYKSLRLVGLIGLLDPPRAQVRESIEACHRAGIRVVMVTGDQPETARAIAESLGLVESGQAPVMTGAELAEFGELDSVGAEAKERLLRTAVFARVSPEQKLELLKVFQAEQHTVAMTGDGVNDAPALKQADIGVAMGKRGTDAAKESADMVLKNDVFASILAAVEQGRVIFANIRKSVLFMLCTNVAEVVTVGVASLLDWPLPIRPLQILFLNVITDVFPALALSVGQGNPEQAMNKPPRSAREPMLGRKQWWAIAAWSGVISVCVLVALIVAIESLGLPTPAAVTVSFLTLGFAKLWFVFVLRDPASSFWRNDIVGNPWIWLALAVCAVLLVAAVHLPGLSGILKTANPGGTGWLLALGLSTVPMVVGQVRLALMR